MSKKGSRVAAALAVARRVKRADGGEVSYDPMTGMRIGADTERTEPEAKPNLYARATIQSIANMPKAMLWDAPRELGEAAGRMPMPGAERAPENEAAMQDLAGQSFMTAIGTAGASLPFAQRGAAGIFGGRLAQTADHAALARAEKMHTEGATPEQIHADTGWFQGPDAKWRFEIPDAKSKFVDSHEARIPHSTDVGSSFDHPDLYAAYPELRDAELAYAPSLTQNGSYRRATPPSPGDLIPPPGERVNINTLRTPEQSRSTMLHELQHAVQTREGFVPGSSPDAMQQVVTAGNDARLWKGMIEAGHTPEEIKAAFPKVIGRDPHPAAPMLAEQMTPEQLAKIETDPYEAYRRIYGEVEARNVQWRRNWTPEERARSFPGSTEDIPREKQLIGAPHDPAAPPLAADVGRSTKNPSPRAIDTLLKGSDQGHLRGLIDDSGAYVWDANKATHHDAAKELGLDYNIENRFHLTPDGGGYTRLDIGSEWTPDRVLANPHLVRMLSNDKILIENGSQGLITGPEYLNEIKGVSHGQGPSGATPGAAPDPAAVGSGGGGPSGAGGLPEAQAAAARWAGERKPLEGLPGALKIGDEHFVPGPIGKVHDVAEAYMREHHPDRPYTPPSKYHKIDPEHSQAIAKAYEDMAHTPNDPATKASYAALIDETAKQYQAIKKTGLKIEPIPAGAEDPYAANPRLAAKDVAENNHLWFFPTEHGFGTVNKISDNPMLRNTGEKIGDRPLLANDTFRIVHDYFGHLKEGHGFRAAGEDNAWRTHSAMYSDIARPAMTTETRGQNSWVNYGPHGEKNRTASGADTTYADQKVGLMPEWTMRDRGSEAPLVAYHAGPHSFGRFDYSKIGTGEGNQAYGQGLYLAGHEPVSEWYRHQLSTRHDPMLKQYGIQDVGHVIGSHLADVGGDAAQLAAKYAGERDKLIQSGDTSRATSNMIDEYARRIDYLNNPQRATGHMYQVAMDVKPEHLLDYDNSFANQSPHVQGRTGPMLEQSIAEQKAAIERLLDKGGTGTPGSLMFRPFTSFKKQDLEGKLLMLQQAGPAPFKGSDIYQRAGMPAGNPNEGAVKASQRLRGMDIPGMRYKDAGSRAPGQQGSHNYVMFGDDMLKILRKYGVVGIPAAGVLAADGEERRAMGGKVSSAMQIARRVKRAGGGGAFGVLSPAEQAEVDDVAPMAIGRSPDDSPVLFKTADPRFGITQQDFDRGLAVGMNAATVGGKGAGVTRRLADDTGAAMTIARNAKRYAEPEFTEGGSRIINKGVENPPDPSVQTVADPHRMMYPGVYRNPRIIAEEAAARVGEEDPAMQRLFGVSRGDLREMAKDRVGNEDPKLYTANNPRGAVSAQNIQTPQNTLRLQDILAEAGRHEGLRTADAWYIMDPVYRRMVELHGPEAAERYRRLNTLTGMASPGSDVMTEIQRGTGAHWLNEQGRFGDFQKYAGVPEAMRSSQRFPQDMRYLGGHPYHRTSQGDPMAKYLEAGSIQSKAPKVPLYVHASGVPETGFQTSGPVGDAHFSRGVGLSDTRKGPSDVQGSFTTSEYQTLQPWWQHEVAGEVGLESVPAQARLWTALGPQTGVESALGAPKLELLSKQIMEAARRLRVSPETARDMVLSGKAGAGVLAGGILAPGAIEAMREHHAKGGAVSNALSVARSLKRAAGGKVHIGPIVGDTGGRADKVPMEVPDGSYVIPADICSALGEGNTDAGMKKLGQMFPESKPSIMRGLPHSGVPIHAADGEFVISPQSITERWGDLESGHRYLDKWVLHERATLIKTLEGLAPPAQD